MLLWAGCALACSANRLQSTTKERNQKKERSQLNAAEKQENVQRMKKKIKEKGNGISPNNKSRYANQHYDDDGFLSRRVSLLVCPLGTLSSTAQLSTPSRCCAKLLWPLALFFF